MLSVNITITGETMLGSTCQIAIRIDVAPAARAASMYGISRMVSTCARMSRANCAQ